MKIWFDVDIQVITYNLQMKNIDKKTIKKWIFCWEQASISLQEEKLKELRSYDYYQKNQFLLNEMLKYAFEHRTVRFSSGLIEQQQIFMKFNSKSIG